MGSLVMSPFSCDFIKNYFKLNACNGYTVPGFQMVKHQCLFKPFFKYLEIDLSVLHIESKETRNQI